MSNAAINFGTDTWCLDSMRTGHLVTGPLLVAQAAYRRLITPRGMLQGGQDEANYGFDILTQLGTAVTPNTVAALPGMIQSELLKDERIQTADVVVTAATNGPAVTFNINIQAQTAAGPFTLVLSVNDVTVALLGITA